MPASAFELMDIQFCRRLEICVGLFKSYFSNRNCYETQSLAFLSRQLYKHLYLWTQVYEKYTSIFSAWPINLLTGVSDQYDKLFHSLLAQL